MVGDFEYTIDESTSKSDVRKWNQLVSESGCPVEFRPPKPYPIIKSRWRHYDFGNVCINYIKNDLPVTAQNYPEIGPFQQNNKYKLIYTDTEARLSHYEREVCFC